MTKIPVALRRLVINRSIDRCEYCQLSQAGQIATFHIQIFNPRLQVWADHFAWQGVELLGLSSVGRATIHALQLNRPIMVAIRSEEVVFDRHPPT